MTLAAFVVRDTNVLPALNGALAALVCGALLPPRVAAQESGEDKSELLKPLTLLSGIVR